MTSTQTALTTACWGMLAVSKDRCQSPAVARVTSGCIHEHIVVAAVCPDHLADARFSKTHCTYCWHSSERHACALNVGREEPIS